MLEAVSAFFRVLHRPCSDSTFLIFAAKKTIPMPIRLGPAFSKKWPKIKLTAVFLVFVTFLQHYHHQHSFFIAEPSSMTPHGDQRTLVATHQSDLDSAAQSLCSSKADERGLDQNVVSYSLYGPFILSPRHFTRYVSRLKENAGRINKVYKGN